MLYTVQEASKVLNISRQTIYNKIDKIKELQEHIEERNNVKYITDEGLAVIRLSMIENVSQPFTKDCKSKPENAEYTKSNDAFAILQKDLINSLYLSIKDLKNDKQNLYLELEAKNEQMKELTNALATSQKLNENNQILLRESQNKILMLEESNNKQSGFWNRIFRKNS